MFLFFFAFCCSFSFFSAAFSSSVPFFCRPLGRTGCCRWDLNFFFGFWSIFLFFFVRVLLELLNRLGFPLRPVRFFSFLFFFFCSSPLPPFRRLFLVVVPILLNFFLTRSVPREFFRGCSSAELDGKRYDSRFCFLLARFLFVISALYFFSLGSRQGLTGLCGMFFFLSLSLSRFFLRLNRTGAAFYGVFT